MMIKRRRAYVRMGDMDCAAALNVYMQDDGDLVVWVGAPYYPNSDFKEVEFCTVGAGGGRSEYTRKALMALIEAIEKDNEERPIMVNHHKVE
jgi:hypothetical protein